jgi:DNA (cytosine-5)-methyltransferase 1
MYNRNWKRMQKQANRLTWRRAAWTVVTVQSKRRSVIVHPTQNRTITVRESARIQSFPDKMIFAGSKHRAYIQIGNAVPVLLARGNMLSPILLM